MSTTNSIVDVLPAHQVESGIVTEGELGLAQRWVAAVTPGDADQAPGDAWLDHWLGTALPFSFRYGGQPASEVLSQWQLQEGEPRPDANCNTQSFVWIDAATGLQLTWQVKRFLDYPAVEWVVTFENRGTGEPPIIEDVQALDFRLRHSQEGRPYTVHGAIGGRSLPDDMMPFSWRLPGAARRTEITLGGDHPSSNRHLPFFNLETPEHRGVMVGVGWSGNWLARMRLEGSELSARAGLNESNFVLRPGERIRTPRVLLLFWEGKRLHGHNMLRQLLHRHYVPPLEGDLQKPLVTVNVCFTHHGAGGYLHEATEEPVLALVDPFARIGTELFIIDAGWYDGEPWDDWMGNWRYSRSKYPRGFRPISERLAALDVLFGIWFMSERVTKNAPVLRDHPEWVRWKESSPYGTLRMELPEAREWFLDQVADLAENELMACYRQDGFGWYDDEPDDRKGISESQHIDGLYASWDTLLQRYPGLVMEGCCGGGRRIDLETVSRFHWHQKSDRWYDVESDQCSLYGANLYLPGGLINIPTEGTDDYTAWSSFAGQFCLAWHPLDEDFPMELALRQVERYKRVRHLLSGDFYPLTPCSLNTAWIGWQFHHVELDAGFAQVFRRYATERAGYPVEDRLTVRLRGLDPQRRYRVRLEKAETECVVTGAALAEGIEVAIEKVPGAEMVTYEVTG